MQRRDPLATVLQLLRGENRKIRAAYTNCPKLGLLTKTKIRSANKMLNGYQQHFLSLFC